MDFWLDLLFGNAVGLSSMIVIFGAIGLMLFYGGFFIYKIMNDTNLLTRSRLALETLCTGVGYLPAPVFYLISMHYSLI